jgi:hypothetical protein
MTAKQLPVDHTSYYTGSVVIEREYQFPGFCSRSLTTATQKNDLTFRLTVRSIVVPWTKDGVSTTAMATTT